MFVVTFGSTLLCWYAWILVLAMIDIRPEYFDAVEEKTGQNNSHNLSCKKALTDEALDGTAKEANGATDDGKGDGGKVRPRPLHLFCPGLELNIITVAPQDKETSN